MALALTRINATQAFGQELTLPTYFVTIDDDDLRQLNAAPDRPDYYPAEVTYHDHQYSAQIKFRGSSALRLPKRSWRIEFVDDHPRRYEALNLDAEYYDRTMMRDHLSMALGRLIGLDVPDERYISLVVNEEYYGVFLEVEPINDDFLERRELGSGEIFASISHLGRGAPFIRDNQFRWAYEIQEGTQEDYDNLGRLLTFMHFTDSSELVDNIDTWIDRSNILQYFALQYVIGNWDGFGKNFHIYRGIDNRYRFLPWDCDAALGNDWAGNWANDYSRLYYDLLFEQTFFRRGMELEGSRERFISIITDASNIYLLQLDSIARLTYDDIRNDAHQDSAKRATNDEFDEEFINLLGYLLHRRQALRDVDSYFSMPEEPRIRVSNNYLSNINDIDTVFIEARDAVEYEILQTVDQDNEYVSVHARDSGENGDAQAGDGIFTATFQLSNSRFPVYYSVWSFLNEEEGYPFPRCGLYSMGRYPAQVPVILINNDPPEDGDVIIVGVDEVVESSSFMIGIKNVRGRPVDLAGCLVILSDSYRKFKLGDVSPLESGDTLWITNHITLMANSYVGRRFTGAFYFTPQIGDTIKIYNAEDTIISMLVLDETRRLTEPSSRVVINEINYCSSDQFDAGDWIELTTTGDAIDLSGWKITDSRDDHVYLIPNGTRLESGDYITIAEDPDKLKSLFNDPGEVLGGFEFTFDNQTDDVRLFNAAGELVDWVSYENGNLWPDEPFGQGATLELVNPSLGNFDWSHWEASLDPNPHGTPGQTNGAFNTVSKVGLDLTPSAQGIISAFPNPFNGVVRIKIVATPNENIDLIIRDLLGRQVERKMIQSGRDGSAVTTWEPAAGLPAGIYYLNINSSTRRPIALLQLK